MRRAIVLAGSGRGLSSPNPTVGCVIVRGTRIVGSGWHRYSKVDHAETVALRQAGALARGATVYVTLEPCCHFGRTPPCARALIDAGVRRVVVAMADPNPRVSGRGLATLRSAGIEVETGVLEGEARKLNEPFACFVATGRPLVVAKAAMSLDGKIATTAGHARWITSPEARAFGQSLRCDMDAVVVGVGTVLADNPRLTCRSRTGRDRPVLRAILDSRLRTSPGHRVMRVQGGCPPLIYCDEDPPVRSLRRLEQAGAEVVPVRRDRSGLRLERVLEDLAGRNVLGVLVEGGSRVHWSFVCAKLVDKFYFIVAPLILGGARSPTAVGGAGFRRIASAHRFEITKVHRLGPDLVLETYPDYSRSILSPWRS